MVVVFTVLTNRDISRLGGSDTRACTIPLTVELDELAAPILAAHRDVTAARNILRLGPQALAEGSSTLSA